MPAQLTMQFQKRSKTSGKKVTDKNDALTEYGENKVYLATLHNVRQNLKTFSPDELYTKLYEIDELALKDDWEGYDPRELVELAFEYMDIIFNGNEAMAF